MTKRLKPKIWIPRLVAAPRLVQTVTATLRLDFLLLPGPGSILAAERVRDLLLRMEDS